MASGGGNYYINVGDTNSMQQMCDNARAAYLADHDFFGNLATKLQNDLTTFLRQKGVESRGLFGGSSAAAAAKKVAAPLLYIAELDMNAAQAFGQVWKNYGIYVVEPVRALDTAKTAWKI